MPRMRSELATAALVVGAECVAVGQHHTIQGGITALHTAASKNSLEMAELLLGAGASVDARDRVRAGCSWLATVC